MIFRRFTRFVISFFTLSSPVMESSSSRRVSTSFAGSGFAVTVADPVWFAVGVFLGSALYLSRSGLGSIA